jgi:hypothetical protein
MPPSGLDSGERHTDLRMCVSIVIGHGLKNTAMRHNIAQPVVDYIRRHLLGDYKDG